MMLPTWKCRSLVWGTLIQDGFFFFSCSSIQNLQTQHKRSPSWHCSSLGPKLGSSGTGQVHVILQCWAVIGWHQDEQSLIDLLHQSKRLAPGYKWLVHGWAHDPGQASHDPCPELLKQRGRCSFWWCPVGRCEDPQPPYFLSWWGRLFKKIRSTFWRSRNGRWSREHLPLFFLFSFSFSASLCSLGESYFPDQGLNPQPRQWERRVLITGPPGNSHLCFLLKVHVGSRNLPVLPELVQLSW